MSTRWIRYQVRETCNDGSGKKFIPHFATDRDTGQVNYDARDVESAKHYAVGLGVPSYVVQVTEQVIAQY